MTVITTTQLKATSCSIVLFSIDIDIDVVLVETILTFLISSTRVYPKVSELSR
jgi:hypothetical protein